MVSILPTWFLPAILLVLCPAPLTRLLREKEIRVSSYPEMTTNLPTLLNGFLLTPGDLDSLALLDIVARLHWDLGTVGHLLLVAIVLGREELLVQSRDPDGSRDGGQSRPLPAAHVLLHLASFCLVLLPEVFLRHLIHQPQ